MQILPPPGPVRRLSFQSGLYAVGSGTFMAGNAVYFTQVVGLTPAQVGLGLTVASLLSMLLAMPVGRLADILGHQRAWAIGAVAEACCYLVYPWVRGMAGYMTIVSLLAVVSSLGGGGRSGYTFDAVAGQGRTQAMAYIRATLNLGFTVGAGIAGLALGWGTPVALQAIPLVTAVLLATNAVLVVRLPRLPGHPRQPARIMGALADLPFVAAMTLTNGFAGLHGVVAMELLPLWLVAKTSAPTSLAAGLFAVNTAMAVALQVRATRGIHDVRSAGIAARRSLLVLSLGCVLVVATPGMAPLAAAAMLMLVMLLATCAELWQSGASWQLMGDLAPAARRGEYSGAATICRQAVQFGAPAALTWLTMSWRTEGWLILAVVLVLVSLLVAPVNRWAERSRAGL